MKIPRQFLEIFMVAAVLYSTAAQAAQAQVDQRALAQQLLGDSATERAKALEDALTLGAPKTGPELRAALVTALERESRVHVARDQAARRGEALQDLENAEFFTKAARAVAELGDPNAIPALASALGTGFPAIRALTAFGEQAAPAVLAVVMSPTSMHYAIDDGLITLRIMVEEMGTHSLSTGTIIQIRRAAEQHLTTGKGLQITTLWRAIDLAIVSQRRGAYAHRRVNGVVLECGSRPRRGRPSTH